MSVVQSSILNIILETKLNGTKSARGLNMMQEISLLELLLWKETSVLVFFRRSFKEIVFLLILKNNLFFGMMKRTDPST